MTDVIISDFSPADKVPGFYGQVQYGVGGNSAAGQPIALILIGLMISSGNLTPNSELRQIFTDADIDAAAGIGSELATMGYDALAAQQDIPIFLASPALPGGATASTATITIGGSPTGGGTIGVRIDGFTVFDNVASGEANGTTATNLAAAINGANGTRLPVSANAVGSTVVLTDITPSIRGNQHIVFLVTSESGQNIAPPGLTVTITGKPWVLSTVYASGSYGTPATANGYYYQANTRAPASGTGATNTQTVNASVITGVTGATADWVGQSFVVTDGTHAANTGTFTITSASTAAGGTVGYTNATPGVNSTTINWSVAFNNTTFTSAPTWPTTLGSTVNDGGLTWTCWGEVVTGGGITMGGGAGLETYTTLISNLFQTGQQGNARFGLACNDSVSVAAWKAKIDGDAGALVGRLEHAVIAQNLSQAGAISLAQTTCNDQRFEVLFELNCETHPPRMAAAFAADRAFEEVSDPNFRYDDYAVPQIVPQSQRADWPVHSQLVAMLNAGVTPIDSSSGSALICRAITTKCLTNGQPDYSTLDVGDAVVPDFVLLWLKGVWTTFQAANKRVRGPLQTGEKQPRSGVAYPALWNGRVQANLARMGTGDIPGTCPPILDPVQTALVPPVTDLDPSESGRLMTNAPVVVMANLHQLGLNVQQTVPSLG